ncbi:MAG: sigma-70 family RNA polymerase sigma factor [Gemmatimonadaceae bacterium]|nr:sigma-70 family RNA polymerase sigma factor [Gemmatimonadaceae bacterium]
MSAESRIPAAHADDLFPVVYEELRRLAHSHRARQGAAETLNTTAVVHEAYLRLTEGGGAQFNDRAHFLAVASRAMRFVLVDHARARSTEKRGGSGRDISLDEALLPADDRSDELLAIDEALTRLEAHDPRLGQLVQVRFFAGLDYGEIAETVGLSVPTVKRDWARARAWLYRFITEDAAPPA